MRWQAVIILIALAFTIIVPPSFTLIVNHAGQPVLGALDVCHSAVPALSSNGHMPCLSECPCKQIPALSVAYSEESDPLFTAFLIISRTDRPPRA